MTAIETVTTLIAAWEARDAQAIAARFAEDGVWHNMPYAPIAGRPAIGAAIERFLGTVGAVTFRVHHIAEIAPGIVVTERNDIFVQGDRTTDIPVMGIFEIEHGHIRMWRDYFDGAAMPAATGA